MMASSQGLLLTGRLALVTGGGSGIGRAVSKTFAREGAKVIVADLNEAGAKETVGLLEGKGHVALKVNVSKTSSVKELFTAIQHSYTRVPDTVVNCAGVSDKMPFLEITEEHFNRVFDINFRGSFLICQEASRLMIEKGIENGSIINLTSVLGRNPFPNLSIYCATKAAIIALTKNIALELGGKNIKCNAIAPGYIDTPMTSNVEEGLSNAIVSQIPMKRKGRPEEIAEMALFLASDKNSYMTGEIVQVSGGLNM